MSDYGIRLERVGHIAVVTVDRAEKLNTFDERMWTELERVAAELASELPRAAVITGVGRAFCAGFDVNPENSQVAELAGALEKGERAPAEKLVRRVREAVDKLVFLPVPVIAALNGIAYGGGAELATRCDIRIADPDAVISFSEVRLGLMPDWGGGVALTRLLGTAKAAELILTARQVTAVEALYMGLVNKISEPGRALEESIELAELIGKNGPRAVRTALEIIRKTPDLSLQESLELETERAADLIATGECIHGIAAFLQKKDPEFPD
jgi:enoyl-CoA hydratase/carnithine racemase